MATRDAACHCGQLRLVVDGDPFVVSACHCRACQRRTGSAFGMQAAFRSAQVAVEGEYKDFTRVSEEADAAVHVFHFCPECGSSVFYTGPNEEDLVVVSVGAFADSSVPPPTESGYDWLRHPWVRMPDGVSAAAPELWAPLHPLYQAGEYAEAADRARPVREEHPDYPDLLYNVACCESLAGRPADAVAHLERAIELSDGFCRGMAKGDTDFDPIRDDPAFVTLVGR